MKKLFTLLALFISLFASSQSTTVVISQVFGGGGSASGTYKSDYVELHNISPVSQDISGFKLFYGSATGTLSATGFTFPTSPAVSIPSGGYLLIANAASTGLANLTPTADYTFSLNLSSTAGKVAFGNTSLTAGTYATMLASGNLIDFVGYGLTATESETSPTATLSSTTAAVRKTNGCTETNNNNTDFNVAAPVARNAASTSVVCSSPSATITATPNITNLITTLGTASVSQSFNISASLLSPAMGNLTISPSAGLEISFDNTTFLSTPQTLAYTGATVASTPIYVRIASTAAQGAVSGTVTCSGGAASNAVVIVSGGVAQNFYSQPTGNLTNTATWGIATNGTGAAPSNFTSPYQIFNVVNQMTPTLGATWAVSGTGSKVIIGDGTNPTTVSTNTTDSIAPATLVDILNNGTIIVGNRVAPTFGMLATGSTVNYNFTGTATTDTVKVNVATYHNLGLVNGLKYLKAGITTVNGNLLYDGTANSNGAATPFSTIVLKGNLTMTNAALIEDSTTGSSNRYTLTMAGNTIQNINTGASELRIFRLQRDTTVLTDLDINLTPNSKIAIGNNSGGDLKLLQKISGTPTITRLLMATNAQVAIVKNASVYTDPLKAGVINATDAKIIINKSVASTTYPGTLKFEPGSSLNNFTVNITTPTKDTINIDNKVSISSNLALTKGVVVIKAGETLEVSDAATLTGGSAASYVDGAVKKFFDPTMFSPTFLYPTGQAKQYAPIEITMAAGNNYTVQYFKQPYSNLNVSAATSAAQPSYHVSNKEYWDISQGDFTAPINIKFYYNTTSGIIDPTQANIAHFNGTDWDDVGRSGNSTDGVGSYINNTMINSFSPFTFGGITGVLPIQLESFTGALQNNTSTLNWKTSCENIGDKFELQYSVDGKNYTTISNADAKGTCIGNEYAYTHINAKAVVNYYRLIIVSTNGAKIISNVIALRNSKISYTIKLVVTNNNEQIGYSIESPTKGTAIIQLTNMQGQIILTQNISYAVGTQIKYINTNNISDGVYLLTITNNEGERATLKFVK